MRAVDIITNKRDGKALSRAEIDFFIRGLASGDIPDYQVAAWAMAVLLRGMTPRETTDLTLAMVASGETIDFTGVADLVVDKHSTRGVGDKTSLVVAPLVSACGLPVAKMSGRGLGYSGGTLDKLDSIPGYRSDLTTAEFLDQMKRVGIVLTGQCADLTPADGKLYALRDVTGTVPSIPLIASSVMSKKIAAGAQAIVLDVKVGSGAFMKDLDEARELAELMVAIGDRAGRKTVALLSEMDQPLGFAVGNALEVREAIETLHGGGPADFREHCLVVAAHMLVLGKIRQDLESAREQAAGALANGQAFSRFRELVVAQGGDPAPVDDPERFPAAKIVSPVLSPRSGYLKTIHARTIGETAVALGAGRARKGDPIDLSVGMVVHHKVGDHVSAGEPLATVHSSDEEKAVLAREAILEAHAFSDEPVPPLPLFYGEIS
jgi:pyrimidine-nucleoside phosphorylase